MHKSSDYFNIIDQFRQAMYDAGISYHGPIIPDGQLHRVHIRGHKPGTVNGRYGLHLDSPVSGWFQDYTKGIKQTWSLKKGGKASPAMVEQMKEAQRERETETRQKQAAASEKAIKFWGEAEPVKRQSQHDYLVEKNILPYGARLRKGRLLIPLLDENYTLCSLQSIDSKGNKRFMPGGKKRGCFFVIGDESAQRTLICEGYATGASLHQYTGDRVVVAFDSGNLLLVAQAANRLWGGEIIICGDNDVSDAGQKAANKAAFTIGAKVLIPPTEGTDWNDVINGDSE